MTFSPFGRRPHTAERSPVTESPLLDQLQIQPHTTREVPFSAADDHGVHIWNSSTSPACIACAANSGPATAMSLPAFASWRRHRDRKRARFLSVRYAARRGFDIQAVLGKTRGTWLASNVPKGGNRWKTALKCRSLENAMKTGRSTPTVHDALQPLQTRRRLSR